MKSIDSRRIHELKRTIKTFTAKLEKFEEAYPNCPKDLTEIRSLARWVDIEMNDLFPPSSETKHSISEFESGILLDDDATVARFWNETGSALGKSVIHYYSDKVFLREADKYEKDIFIYVDWYLSPSTDSIALIKEISARGFKNIIITTHAVHLDLSSLPWVKAIIKKDPPWATHQQSLSFR